MTRPLSEEPLVDPKSISKTDVLEWLKAHPDFLAGHPEIFDHQRAPKSSRQKGVADFQHYMVERLKADKHEALETTKAIVETSRANMTNQSRVHMAVLALLGVRDLEGFLQTITQDCAAILDVDVACLGLESNGRDLPHITQTGVRILPPGAVEAWTQGRNCLLESDIAPPDALYGGAAGLVASHALIRLNIAPDAPPGILAFGSRDPDAFHPQQGTEQIHFLSRVVERMLCLWLDLPQ